MSIQHDTRLVAFRGSLTTPTSEQTHQTIREALEGSDSVVLDCAGAEEIDVSFLQILVAAGRAAERGRKTIGLAGPAQGALAEALRRCGFAAAEGKTALRDLFGLSAS